MTHYTTLSSNLKRGILTFSKGISESLNRPQYKFVSQMIYGLLCSQSCHLSKISRVLNENVLLKKTIERLSRNLASFTKGDVLLNNYIKKIKRGFSDRAILIIDDGDITKPCSTKMEGLRIVHDGSTGINRPGYHMLDVTALTPEHKAPIGVYSRVYSAGEETFVSATDETLKALRFLRTHFKRTNVRAFDRGFDANIYIEDLLNHKEKFVLRIRSDRNVIYKGETTKVSKLAEQFKGKYVLRFKRKNRKQADCKISIVTIRMCFRPNEALNLVICHGLGQEPMLLLTNLNSDDDHIAVTVTKVYLLRWRIEEFHGFKKQQFGFEDFRVRSLNAIRTLDLLLTIAIGYIGIMSEKSDDRLMVMELIHVSKRIYGVPRFRFYALADGIYSVLSKGTPGVSHMLKKQRRCGQLCLFSEKYLSTA